jgi:uncharacterized protein (DUF58 family)
MEFAEVRPYQPGDDVRAIDWNVTARMGTPYVKQYVEERDLTVFLASTSRGAWASARARWSSESWRPKSRRSSPSPRCATRTGWARPCHRPAWSASCGRSDAAQVLRLVLRDPLPPRGGGTDLESALNAALTTLHQRAVLFLISDFLDAPPRRALERAAARHDLVLLEIVDPRDLELPEAGPVVLEDAETGRRALFDGGRSARAESARRQAERAEVRQLAARLGIDRVELRTDRPYLPELVRLFARRERRLRR